MLLKNKKRDVDPPPKIVGEEDKHLFYAFYYTIKTKQSQ
nr:MAG TPA: hypothetical protein [Caudoviricetes sp.]